MMDKKPPPPPPRGLPCQHKYKHLDTVFSREDVTHGYIFRRVDIFFCEKCLKEQIKEKSEQTRGDYPSWWKEK